MDFDKAFETNRDTWNEKTAAHYNSAFYDKSAFAKTRNSLNSYELNALPDVSGKSLLHLQCHFGQDSLSWASKGAQVTGVDISDMAIEKANQLSKELDIPANFVYCNVLDTSDYIEEQFDIVFTSYGVIGWLPDLKPWAKMVAERLKDGGIFYMVEFHPIAWMYDYLNSKPVLKYHYNQTEVIYEEYKGTYADPDSQMISKEYTWNHSLSIVIQALLDAGLSLEYFAEHDGSPYEIFPEMVKSEDGLYCLKDQKYPLLFELKVRKGKEC